MSNLFLHLYLFHDCQKVVVWVSNVSICCGVCSGQVNLMVLCNRGCFIPWVSHLMTSTTTLIIVFNRLIE